MNRACLNGDLFGEPCGPDTPTGELCDPCARLRLLGDVGRASEAEEGAYLAGYAQGWEDRAGRSTYADLEGLAGYLKDHPR